MKRILLFLLSGFTFAYSQGVAPDWTLNDCDGIGHNLYTQLDSQEVVVMFFVMGCGSCTSAGDYINRMNERYDNSYPGKVNFYLMDYYPSNTCYDVDTTWNTYNFDAYFSGCWNVKDYYFPSVYPMPAVVVVGGISHQVLYEDLSWQNSDTTLIENSINAVIDNLGIGSDDLLVPVSVFPNPASQNIIVTFDEKIIKEPGIKVYSVDGKNINDYELLVHEGIASLHFLKPQTGEYIIELTGSGIVVRKKFILKP